MKNSIKIAFVAAFAAVGIAACSSAPAVENNAAPATQSSTPSSAPTETPPAVVTEVVTQTVTNPAQPQAVTNKKVDNRPGYGALKLGMTVAEVKALGMTVPEFGDDICAADGKLAISKKYGVVRITLPADAKTSTGIGVGSTYAAVKKAHPDAQEYRAGYSAGLGDYHYAFIGNSSTEHFKDTDEVVVIKLGSNVADCAMFQL